MKYIWMQLNIEKRPYSGKPSANRFISTSINVVIRFIFMALLFNSLACDLSINGVSIDGSINSAPKSEELVLPVFNEDAENVITLKYSDLDGDLAEECALTDLNQIQIERPCSCVAGVCTVTVIGTAEYSGTAGFSYTVTANGMQSTPLAVALTIVAVDDPPVVQNLAPNAFVTNMESVILLDYTDSEGDLASTCSLSGLSQITETTPCACTGAICSVGVTGLLDYSGGASFEFTVTTNSLTSPMASANFTIIPPDDITLSNFTSSSPLSTSVAASVTFSGDFNANASVKLYYCNQSSSPGCTPNLPGGGLTMIRGSGVYTGSLVGLSAPGNTLNLEVIVADTDGVTGTPLTKTENLILLNNPPALTASCALTAKEGLTYNCSPSLVDPDGPGPNSWILDTALSALHTCGAWLTINSTSGAISGSPGAGDTGPCVLAFYATDSATEAPNSLVESFNLVVDPIVNDVTVSNFKSASTLPTAYYVSVDFSGDENGNAVASVYHCNESDNPGCTPNVLAVALTKYADFFSGVVTGLGGGDAPGEILNLSIVVTDPDGTTGGPVAGNVTLANLTDTWYLGDPTFSIAGRYHNTAVWSGTEMLIWGGKESGGPFLNTGARYNPTTDSWAPIQIVGAPEARRLLVAVWTGTKMVVWSGKNFAGTQLNSGGRYDPATDSWAATTTAGAPTARVNAAAIWSGAEMIVWGGYSGASQVNSGGKYNPITDTWVDTSTVSAPSQREGHSLVWTGTEVLTWGGYDGGILNDGGKYDPGVDSWSSITLTNAPNARTSHGTVWTGTEMLVWGGDDAGSTKFNTGAKYNPTTNSWTTMTTTAAPTARVVHSPVWTGSEVIIWGGTDAVGDQNTGGRYNPSTDAWTTTSLVAAPTARGLHASIWTGTEFIVWGGVVAGLNNGRDGGRYDPATDSWSRIMSTAVPAGRDAHSSVWTGSEMIIWGGKNTVNLNSGAKYSPTTNSWTGLQSIGAPSARSDHTGVWTDTEMIVWGGTDGVSFFDTGARYDPSLDAWTPMATLAAPIVRAYHGAIWTGTDMIIWGGAGPGLLGSGGIYDPMADSWTATSLTGSPTVRNGHTTIWTGSKMVIWGGWSGSGYLNTGGRYDPVGDTWQTTTTSGSPGARNRHISVWTGTEVVIWGGKNGGGRLNTGGKYYPTNNVWSSTTTANAPAARLDHAGVWTGSEVIVWGGQDNGTYFNSGAHYDPVGNSWLTMSTTGVPTARGKATAIWTDTEMIIWGGSHGTATSYYGSGGRYFP